MYYIIEFLNLKFTDNPMFISSLKDTYVDTWPYFGGNAIPDFNHLFFLRLI